MYWGNLHKTIIYIKFNNENKFMGGNSLIRIIKKSKYGN